MSPMSTSTEHRRDAEKVSNLEELLSIAVVITAGCESCAEKMVGRAVERGAATPMIARTIEVVGRLRSLDCFARAVGSEVTSQMEKPLQAARDTLNRLSLEPKNRRCCE